MNENCKGYQHQITLHLYDELAEGTRVELEAHLRECDSCRETFDAEKAMHSALAGEVSQPLRFHGRMEDDTVRQLLFSALRDRNNPGSRLKAIEVLSQKPTDESIEEALISSLVYDDDPGVRMRALEGLKTFANEQHVRAAFVHTLQNDNNSGIRIEAIDALT